MKKAMMMAAAAIALSGVAGAQIIRGAWIQHQIMSCYRPSGNDVVKCDAAVGTAGSRRQIQPLGSLTLTAGDGKQYMNTAVVVNGKTETLNAFGDFSSHTYDVGRPIMATYLFKVPLTVQTVTVTADTGGIDKGDKSVSNVQIKVPNIGAAVTIYKTGVPTSATSFVLSDCKKVGANQYSCSTVTGK